MNQPSGAWWKQLSNHLHERTLSRLRGLQIRAVSGRVSIKASAPCDRVRSLAEAAAREVVPEELLALRIAVDAPIEHDAPLSETPTRGGYSRSPALFSGHDLHRRMHRLVNGN